MDVIYPSISTETKIIYNLEHTSIFILPLSMIQMNWICKCLESTTYFGLGDGTMKSATPRIIKRDKNISKDRYWPLWTPLNMIFRNNPFQGLSLLQSKVSDLRELDIDRPLLDIVLYWNPNLIIIPEVIQSIFWNIYHLSLIQTGLYKMKID